MKTLALSLGVFLFVTFSYQESARPCGFKLIDAPRGMTVRDVSRPRQARSVGPRRSPLKVGPRRQHAPAPIARGPESTPVDSGPEPTTVASTAVETPTPEPAAEPAVEKQVTERAPAPRKAGRFVKVMFFKGGSADLTSSATAALDVNARWLTKNPGASVTIEGHASSVGSPAFNKTLSEARAEAAKSYLVEQGVDASRIQVASYGDERPAYRPASSTKNRRVVIQRDE